jgi:hypothetical protein
MGPRKQSPDFGAGGRQANRAPASRAGAILGKLTLFH